MGKTGEVKNGAGFGGVAASRWMVLLIVAVIYALFMVEWSSNFGRLSQDPTHDDVGYLSDGLKRARICQDAGFSGFLADLVNRPPHSPYSSIQCSLSFLLFGADEKPAYFLNVLPLIFIFWLFAKILSPVPWPIFGIFLLSLLPVPLFKYSIHELRPDFFVACLGASGCYLIIRGGFLRPVNGANDPDRSAVAPELWPAPRLAILGGVFIGLALIVKPTIFAHTLALTCAAGGLATFEVFLSRWGKWRMAFQAFLKLFLGAAAPVLLIASPYFFSNSTHILEYFFKNTHSDDAKLWQLPGGFLERLLKVLIRGEIGGVLGNYLIVLVLFTAIGLAILLVAGRWRQARLTVYLWVVVMTSVMIFTYGSINNVFFGMTFQLLAIVGCLSALVGITPGIVRNVAFAGLIVGFAGVSLKSGPYPLWETSHVAAGPGSLNRLVVESAQERLHPTKENPAVVFVAFTGWISADSMNWIAESERLPLRFIDNALSSDLNKAMEMAETSNCAVIASPNAAGVHRWAPSSSLQESLFEKMSRNENFSRIELPTATGPMFLFFRNPK